MRSLHLMLAGAPIDTGNRGVEALGRSVIDAVDRDGGCSTLGVLDGGWGVRPEPSGRYTGVEVELVGVRLSRRWHRPESWTRVRLDQALGSHTNHAATRLARADAVLDISGGDSFTDLYGPTRLRTVSAPKEAALRAGTPLVLLPQTFGPFTTAEGRRRAERLVRRSALAYARDALSLERLLELAGPDADPTRCRPALDVAFALEPRRPAVVPQGLAEAEDTAEVRAEVYAGVNVSGLLREPGAKERFGLAGDYLATMTDLVQRLVDDGARVVLVPHVHVAGGAGESDIAAVEEILARVGPARAARITVVPPTLDAAELKWCVSTLDWFVGSRMHSTIAGLSTAVATFGYAYSDKAAGVFATCGAADQVLDAREVAGPEAVDAMLSSFTGRADGARVLREHVPAVTEQARAQLVDLLGTVRGWADGAAPAGSVA